MSNSEPVHTMTDYYDGPRAGIADVDGVPHLYDSTFADIDRDDRDVFELRVVDDDTLRLALEDWQIWLRWEAAYHAGRTPIATHPALPEETDRHLALKGLLEPRLFAIRARAPDVRAHAEFERVDDALRVRWWKLVA